MQVAVGSIGGLPAAPGQAITASIIGPSRLSTPEAFRDILLRVNPDGSQVRIGDVARVSLNAESYTRDTKYNGKPAAGVAIRLAAGQNALETVDEIHKTLDRLSPFFPRGLEIVYPLDTTPFVRTSIREVVKTLFEAVALVFLVMYVFLQNARATLIPTIAVPIVLLGTFGILAAFGFSINTLTMFGMALSIGLLVDDAIVVVENVERVMAEDGLGPREATRRSMDQITGALVAIALVLAAVFVPMAFFGGSIGVIYRQFSITLVSAMALSVLVALVLTPALCATILKPLPPSGQVVHTGFFAWFNHWFERGRARHADGMNRMLARTGRSMLVYLGIVAAMALLFMWIPSSFLPNEDTGFMFGQVQTPPGASRERTWAALDKAQHYLTTEEKDTVDGVLTVNGFNFAGTGQNSGLLFIKLKDWSERTKASQQMPALLARANKYFSGIKEANIIAVAAAGRARTRQYRRLRPHAAESRRTLARRIPRGAEPAARARPRRIARLAAVRPNGVEDAPQFQLDIDREKASALGVSIADINQTLQAGWASVVRERLHRPRPREARVRPGRSAVAHAARGPRPLVRAQRLGRHGALLRLRPRRMDLRAAEADALQRRAGLPDPGRALARAQLRRGDGRDGGNRRPPACRHRLRVERPLRPRSGSPARRRRCSTRSRSRSSSCASPRSTRAGRSRSPCSSSCRSASFGAVLATLSRGLSNDAYFQVGLLVTIGLAAKNAVLIVEFAKENFDRGIGLVEAVIQATRQRLRPILMTSLAFMAGVLPLALAGGAGSGAQNAVGTGVIGGMLTSTFLAVFFVPVFFVVVLRALPRPADESSRQ